MTDLDLIAYCAERLRVREADAKKAGNKKAIVALGKLHKGLAKVMKAYAIETGGDVVAFSGGVKLPD